MQPTPIQLTPVQTRVLGSLIEKEITTPEYYPLSLNALLAACNQKSSREPVMTLSEAEVQASLRGLEEMTLVSVEHGTRVERYENRARTVLQLRRDETAILCLLLLRGPQTAGELRGRAERLFVFDDVAAVQATLARMSAPTEARPYCLVNALPRQAGTKEQRYGHALGDTPPEFTPGHVQEQATSGTLKNQADAGRLGALEARITVLEGQVARLLEAKWGTTE